MVLSANSSHHLSTGFIIVLNCAALLARNSVIIIGGADDFVFTFGASNQIHSHFAIHDGMGDPIMMNGFRATTLIPPAEEEMERDSRGSNSRQVHREHHGGVLRKAQRAIRTKYNVFSY